MDILTLSYHGCKRNEHKRANESVVLSDKRRWAFACMEGCCTAGLGYGPESSPNLSRLLHGTLTGANQTTGCAYLSLSLYIVYASYLFSFTHTCLSVFSFILNSAFSKDVSYQANFGQETEAKPSLASVDSSTHGQYGQVQFQTSSLASYQVGIVKTREKNIHFTIAVVLLCVCPYLLLFLFFFFVHMKR